MNGGYSEILTERIVTKLRKGAEKGRIELSSDDCEKLLFLLRTSVPLEPFLNVFTGLLKQTVEKFPESDKSNDS